jgi:hypothetical protein
VPAIDQDKLQSWAYQLRIVFFLIVDRRALRPLFVMIES